MLKTQSYIQHSIENRQDSNWKGSCMVVTYRITKFYLLGIFVWNKKERITEGGKEDAN